MIQVFCPACESVVWVEGAGRDDRATCPECGSQLLFLTRRKARPLTDIAAHVARPPLPTQLAPDPLPDEPPDDEAEAVEDVDPGAGPEEEVYAGPAAPASAEEDEVLAVRPASAARFVALPYRAEGGCSVLRLPLFFAALPAAGAALGWVASAVGQICYLILLFPLALGLALACLGAPMVRWARLRNPTLAGLGGLAGGVAAIVVMQACDWQATLRLVRVKPGKVPAAVRLRLTDNNTLPAYLDATARVGVTVCVGSDGTGYNLGPAGTWLYWVVELMVAAGLPLLAARAAATRPFCPRCRTWKPERVLGSLHDSGGAEERLWRGDLARLAADEGGGLVLSVSACACGGEVPLDVRLERRKPAEDLAQLTFPGEALPVLEALFETPASPECQQEDTPACDD